MHGNVANIFEKDFLCCIKKYGFLNRRWQLCVKQVGSNDKLKENGTSRRLGLWSAWKVRTAKCWNQSSFNEQLHISSVWDQDEKLTVSPITVDTYFLLLAESSEHVWHSQHVWSAVYVLRYIFPSLIFSLHAFPHFTLQIFRTLMHSWKHWNTDVISDKSWTEIKTESVQDSS